MGNDARRPPTARYEDRCKRRQVELDDAARELVDVCRNLGDVSAVFAYGSYAKRLVGPDSDLDALIVRHCLLSRSARQDDIRLQLRARVGFDLLVYYRSLTTQEPAMCASAAPPRTQNTRLRSQARSDPSA
jgi:predicted nucleotidyltransferase